MSGATPKKYGEIGRVKSFGVEYILHSTRYPYGQDDIPWISLKISRKTAKKFRKASIDDDAAYALRGDAPVSTIRAIVRALEGYLETSQVDTFASSPYRDKSWKRQRFYAAQMKRLGWDMETIPDGYNEPTLIFTRA